MFWAEFLGQLGLIAKLLVDGHQAILIAIFNMPMMFGFPLKGTDDHTHDMCRTVP